MKGKHIQMSHAQLAIILDWIILIAVIVGILTAIPTVRNLINLRQNVGKLQTNMEILENQQDRIKTALTHKITTRIDNKVEPEETAAKLEPVKAYMVTMEELQTLAKIIYREGRGLSQTSHKAAIIWCILNRVDDGRWGNDIITVATYPNAFVWEPDTPVDEDLLNLALDVVIRWNCEKQNSQDVGRTLPASYLYFTSEQNLNLFTEEWGSDKVWDWSLPDPYVS